MTMPRIAATLTAIALAATLMVPLTVFVKAEMRTASAVAPMTLLQR